MAPPLRRAATGTEASLGAITREDIARYHRTWWRPDNATLVITGSLDAEAASHWPSGCSAAGGRRRSRWPPSGVARRPGRRAAVVVIDMPTPARLQ
jgi:zinc protease